MTVIDEPQTMYNLTISLVATYLVGEQGWVVHNQDLDICKYLPAGETGQYRLQTKDGPPSGVSGIYEYIDRTRGDRWYVGLANNLRYRLTQEKGRWANWEDIIWTPINAPQIIVPKLSNNPYWFKQLKKYKKISGPWQIPQASYKQMLRAAEKIRIIQLEHQFGGRAGIANAAVPKQGNKPEMLAQSLQNWLIDDSGISKSIEWPDWLVLDAEDLQNAILREKRGS
ncbi:MAG: hypothetical protein AAFV93_21050 [Chloroflexota bacterium]